VPEERGYGAFQPLERPYEMLNIQEQIVDLDLDELVIS